MRKIISIVEGEGEVSALPALLHLISPEQKIIFQEPWNLKGRFSLSRGGSLTRQDDLDRLLEATRTQHRFGRCDGVLILQDSDKECPVDLAYTISARAEKLGLPFPVATVYAVNEYESWFLASLKSLVGQCNIPEKTSFPSHQQIQDVRGAKEWLSEHMTGNNHYVPTRDQLLLTRMLDPNLIRQQYYRLPKDQVIESFRRLEHALDQLIAGQAVATPKRH